jgi:glycosyltransferase involved in cell wall biosynthesis
MEPLPRIVFFTNSMAMGGMEAHVGMLAAGLQRHGVPVTAFVPDDAAINSFRDGLRDCGAEVRTLASSGGGARRLPGRLMRMTAALRALRPFMLHVHLTGPDGGLLPVVAARLAGARAVLRTEHLPPYPRVSARQKALVRLRDAWTDRVICVSEDTRREHLRVYGRDATRLVSVPNGVEPHDYAGAAARRAGARALLGAGESAIIIGAIGRMAEERKGFDTFIAMAARVAAARGDAQFMLVGDGPLRASLEAQARAHALNGRLRFTGRLDNRDVLPGMDIFVSPSVSEGGPITILEAMASRVPVVATATGVGCEAIRDGDNGRLVRAGDASGMAQAVLSLCADADRRAQFGERGHAVVAAQFTIEAMVERVMRVYAGAAAPHRQTRAADAAGRRAT